MAGQPGLSSTKRAHVFCKSLDRQLKMANYCSRKSAIPNASETTLSPIYPYNHLRCFQQYDSEDERSEQFNIARSKIKLWRMLNVPDVLVLGLEDDDD
jgi:hypothetical protein